MEGLGSLRLVVFGGGGKVGGSGACLLVLVDFGSSCWF